MAGATLAICEKWFTIDPVEIFCEAYKWKYGAYSPVHIGEHLSEYNIDDTVPSYVKEYVAICLRPKIISVPE